jgi:hypothetical protein
MYYLGIEGAEFLDFFFFGSKIGIENFNFFPHILMSILPWHPN